MSTVIKDLGAVSAYAYAVEKGYTGTEAEFAELMADYAEVGQRAEDAANSALESKTAAQTAATTATTKASEAATSAQTATTKAGEASQSASQAQASAQTASTKASEASASASTATAKATEATTAATSANTAKTDAVAAKTAAETAQGKAETAQGAAEDAAQSVSASAAQIATNTADITDLKEELNSIEGNAGMALAIKPQIPTYFFGQPDTPLDFSDIEYLESKIASVPEGKHFFFITDTHWPNNQKHSTQLMAYIGARLGIKHVLFGGDAINNNPTKYLAYQVLASYVNENKAIFGENFLYCLGNHDNNLANQSGTAEEKQTFVIPYLNIHELVYNGSVNYYDASADLTGIVTDEADYANMVAYFKNCYYLDDAENKIRYIIYNTGTVGNEANLANKYFGVGNVSESMLCVEWMYRTLMSTPSGYDVVVVGHEPVYEYGEPYLTNSNKQIPTLLMAFKAKATASIWIQTNFDSRLFSWIAKGTHTYDFSQANDVGKVVVLSGHWHQDYIVTVSPSNHVYNTGISGTGSRSNTVSVSQSAGSDVQLPIVVTQCDKVANAGDTSASAMTVGTITEQCFDVVTLANDGHIYMTRIGAGSDRIIEFT